MTVGSDFDFYSPYYLAYGIVSYEGMSREPKMKVTVKAELNPFIKGMVEKPLQEGVEKIVNSLQWALGKK